MEFPKWKKKLHSLWSPLERVITISKKVALSAAGLLTLAPIHTSGAPKSPPDPRQTVQVVEVSKFNAKHILRAIGGSPSSFLAQHRSHSSHSSHS
jgi:hypothetical protein